MTEKKLMKLNDKVIEAENKLNSALSDLAIAASEVLGCEVTACLCNGGEIEMRTVDNSGYIDADSTIRLEDVISELKRKLYDGQTKGEATRINAC